jgi:hypothetical protein
LLTRVGVPFDLELVESFHLLLDLLKNLPDLLYNP